VFDVPSDVSKASSDVCFSTSVLDVVCRLVSESKRSGTTPLYSRATWPSLSRSSTTGGTCGLIRLQIVGRARYVAAQPFTVAVQRGGQGVEGRVEARPV